MSDTHSPTTDTLDQPKVTTKLFAVVAEYDNADNFLHAAEKVRDSKQYTHWDTHAPFPVHGLPEAMGLKPTVLPWIVFAAGMSGLIIALFFQWWSNGFHYPHILSGKPYWALPANIPIGFELTVLFAAITSFLSVFVLNQMPNFYSPLQRVNNFHRATSDRFFVVLDAANRDFNADTAKKFLEETHPVAVNECHDLVTGPGTRLPRLLVFGGLVLLIGLFLPPVMIARARQTKSELPRIQPVKDMDSQPKFKAQADSLFYATHANRDGRAMRPSIPGTVPVGQLYRFQNDHYMTGKVNDTFAIGFPSEVLQDGKITPAFVELGEKRYNIHCSACHGYTGHGGGPVAKRAFQLADPGWVPPTTYHSDYLRGVPEGYLYNVVVNGVRKMPGYGHVIPNPQDRWAIVAYLRALQKSQYADLDVVPVEKRAEIRESNPPVTQTATTGTTPAPAAPANGAANPAAGTTAPSNASKSNDGNDGTATDNNAANNNPGVDKTGN